MCVVCDMWYVLFGVRRVLIVLRVVGMIACATYMMCVLLCVYDVCGARGAVCVGCMVSVSCVYVCVMCDMCVIWRVVYV